MMLDPEPGGLVKALQEATAQGYGGRMQAVCGQAERLPLADQSVDVVISRGSIYFWQDQARGLAELYRVLRPGGQAMIGGGLGSDYPLWARREFTRRRHEGARSKGPEAYARFLWLRSPEAFDEWARGAGIPSFEITGEGGLPPEDPRTGLGIWLRFTR